MIQAATHKYNDMSEHFEITQSPEWNVLSDKKSKTQKMSRQIVTLERLEAFPAHIVTVLSVSCFLPGEIQMKDDSDSVQTTLQLSPVRLQTKQHVKRMQTCMQSWLLKSCVRASNNKEKPWPNLPRG